MINASIDQLVSVPVASSKLEIGSLIAGRFQLEKPLGEGGMGAVWAARHVMTKRAVAIKFLKAPANLDLIQRFVREARAANAVKHPNVVQVHDVFDLENGLPAMVMDLFEGESLASKLERSGALSLAELERIMAPVLSALAAIHAAGIVHRDLKPDNIFMADLGDGKVEPMVLDFGVCKLDDCDDFVGELDDVSTTAGRIMGTPCYMAPEQVRGAVDVDARADIWALGIILFEAVSGVRPFDGDSMDRVISAITTGPVPRLDEAAANLPAELVSLIERMLVRERDARLADLGEVLATLQRVAAQSPNAVARSPGGSAQKTRVRRRSAPDAATLARSKLPTQTHGAVVSNVAPAVPAPSRAARYFAAVFAAALVVGLLVGVLRTAPSRAQAAREAPALSVASSQAAPVPPSPALAPPVASATGAVVSVSELPVESGEARAPATLAAPAKSKAAKPYRKRFQNGIEDFGGRR